MAGLLPRLHLLIMKVKILKHTIIDGKRCRVDEEVEIKKERFNPKYMQKLNDKGPKVGTRHVRKSNI